MTGHSLPRLDGNAVRQHIALLQREPFRDLLSRLLECAPDDDSLREFARKHPDRWAQSLAIAGRLAGYSEKTETRETNLYMQINVMSDADLFRLLDETRAQLSSIRPGELIEAQKESPPIDSTGIDVG